MAPFITRKTKGTLAADLAGERRRAARAKHALRRRIVGVAVVVSVIGAVAAFVFAVASGSSESSRQNDPGPVTTTPSDVAGTGEPVLTERGTIPKEVGEIAGFGPPGDPDQNTFAIEDIVVDPACAIGHQRPASGHTVLLYATAHTGADAKRAGMLGRILAPGFFAAIGPHGRRHDAWPGECTDMVEALPDDFSPNQTYSGTIELRLPIRTGTLILTGVMENAAGWEWRF